MFIETLVIVCKISIQNSQCRKSVCIIVTGFQILQIEFKDLLKMVVKDAVIYPQRDIVRKEAEVIAMRA